MKTYLRDAAEYRLNIHEECFRFNTLSPPPRPEVLKRTDELEKELGSKRSFFVVLVMPIQLAQFILRKTND